MKTITHSLTKFEDVNGNQREIIGCPLPKLPELQQAHRELLSAIAEVGEEQNLADLYSQIRIRALCDRCLSLCGVNPAWLDGNMTIQLLHHYQAEDGLHRGLLAELHYL